MTYSIFKSCFIGGLVGLIILGIIGGIIGFGNYLFSSFGPPTSSNNILNFIPYYPLIYGLQGCIAGVIVGFVLTLLKTNPNGAMVGAIVGTIVGSYGCPLMNSNGFLFGPLYNYNTDQSFTHLTRGALIGIPIGFTFGFFIGLIADIVIKRFIPPNT